ncbi:MAG TPA: hypothetical protein VK324_16960 [Tepidisphaeraceae bacterium]|nr:hypothetical protein [Tepidisphaeraceae bacterium]
MRELTFIITEDDVDGGFTARAVGQSIFTEGETRDELVANIRDAVRCHFDRPEDVPTVLHLHFVRDEVLAL